MQAVGSSPAPLARIADRRMLAGMAAALAQVVLGLGLVGAGVAVFLVASPGLDSPRAGILATAAIGVGLVMVFGPWWWRLTHDLAVERRERIRSEERAEVAAHLHDSVLQTLALIQRNADDPPGQPAWPAPRSASCGAGCSARAGARRRRRDPGRRPAPGRRRGRGPSTASASRSWRWATARSTTGLAALVAASREAHGQRGQPLGGADGLGLRSRSSRTRSRSSCATGAPASTPATVPGDRQGMRESIVGRMARHGGTAAVSSAPGEGTEVELVMPR